MTKLEQKLIKLGYVKISYNYMTKLKCYEKIFNRSKLHFYIRDDEIVTYEALTINCGTQYESVFLQEGLDQLQKDLKEL